MPEFTGKIIQELAPNLVGVRLVYISGNSALINDTFTIPNLTIVIGAYIISSPGSVGALTFSTNIITVTNGGALSWSGLAWGS